MALIEELVNLGLILREPSEQGNLLLFPGHLTQGRGAMPAPDLVEPVRFEIQGAIDMVFHSVLVKSARGSLFTLNKVFSDGARFTARFGGECALRLKRQAPRAGSLRLSFSDDASEETRLLFEETVAEHLGRHLDSGAWRRSRIFACPGCDTPVSKLQVRRRRERNLDRLNCPVCETSISIRDGRDRLAGP